MKTAFKLLAKPHPLTASAASDCDADFSTRCIRLPPPQRVLLDDDAVLGPLQTENLTRRRARRLFDRLTSLGAVRELSGRSSFRLYEL